MAGKAKATVEAPPSELVPQCETDDDEVLAIAVIVEFMETMDDNAQRRVMSYLYSRYGDGC